MFVAFTERKDNLAISSRQRSGTSLRLTIKVQTAFYTTTQELQLHNN